MNMAGGRTGGTDIGLLFLRLALGGIFLAHGVMKVLPSSPGVSGLADTLAKLGIPYPYPAAVATIASEIGGGAVVILGLGIIARLGALSLAVVMVVAILKVHLQNGFFLPMEAKAPGPIPMGYEYNVALLAMALCILFAGPGKFGLMGGKGGGGGDKP
jgi:putative oxidoreductase